MKDCLVRLLINEMFSEKVGTGCSSTRLKPIFKQIATIFNKKIAIEGKASFSHTER